MAASISASVGAGGTNSPRDVRLVQDLLNRNTGGRLAVDGVCGPLTTDAIRGFQKGFLARPDGRVDPSGLTWRHLSGDETGSQGAAPTRGASSDGASGPADGLSLQQLASRGRGYYSYSAPDRQYGTDAMLRLVVDVGSVLSRSGLAVGVGDISLQQGGRMPPHSTHQSGRNADLRPLRVDNAQGPTSIGDPTYSRASTKILVEALLADSSVKRILFNDTEIPGVRSYTGHHNHLHVELR